MPPDGYKDVSTAAETDFNGINSVVINYRGYQAKVHDNRSNRGNIFEKLQNDTLVVGKEEVKKVLDDVAKAVQDKIKTEIDVQKEAERQKLKLIVQTKKSIQSIKGQEKVSLCELNKALTSALNEAVEAIKAEVSKGTT